MKNLIMIGILVLIVNGCNSDRQETKVEFIQPSNCSSKIFQCKEA